VNSIKTVNNSSLPISIKKEQNHLAAVDKCSKLFTGLTVPMAGPIFPSDEAAAPNPELKSSPINVKITALHIKISMYKIKNESMFITMF